MATFDFARLEHGHYDLSDVNGASDFQVTVQDFMNVVRTNANFFDDNNRQEIAKFCSLLEDDAAWQVASSVIPEFRLCQDHNIQAKPVLNTILRTLIHKRPRVPINDPAFEDKIFSRMDRQALEYLEAGGLGMASLNAEEAKEAESFILRTLNILKG